MAKDGSDIDDATLGAVQKWEERRVHAHGAKNVHVHDRLDPLINVKLNDTLNTVHGVAWRHRDAGSIDYTKETSATRFDLFRRCFHLLSYRYVDNQELQAGFIGNASLLIESTPGSLQKLHRTIGRINDASLLQELLADGLTEATGSA